ncbi:MAG: IS4 family transposase [Lentisphaerota bacterium]
MSRRVCEWLDWRTTNGKWQEGSCRKSLAELRRRGALNLPEQVKRYGFQQPRKIRTLTGQAVPDLRCSLAELGKIELVAVRSRQCKDWRIWRALLDQYHNLGSGSPRGAQIRYLIKSSRYGYLGALSFSSATWALRDRDRYIGWSEGARIANLRYVVSNDRFLILPTVSVKNLASHVLASSLSRLPDDWEARYHIRPALVETFVDTTRFSGTCYKAANWIPVGHTAGRRDGIPKAILLHPLAGAASPSSHWREFLCREPKIGLGEASRPESPSNWAEEEFGTLRLYDARLKQRLFTIAQDFYNRSQANIPEACGSKARTIGAYRFFQNEKVTMDVLLTPHTEATIERINEHKIVLAPQDTTTLNYGHHPATTGLGPINNIDNKSLGLILHDTLAFTEEGTPLGVLNAQCWARDPDDKGKARRRKKLPIEQKESLKWLRSYRRVAEIQKLCPDTMLVSIGDREADIYELFLEADKNPSGPKLLVRAEKSRNRKVEQQALWEFMSGLDIAGALKIHIPKRGNQKAREAIVDVRFSEVQLAPPKGKGCPPIKVWAVYVLETETEEGVASLAGSAPIEWMLLTTAEVHTFEDAKQRVEWYSGRWGIEVYHRTLKTGCRIKDRQLGTADRLEACLGVDMVVAWRIYHLTMLGREAPDHPCTVFFEDIEWKALCCFHTKTSVPPEEPPSMEQAVRMVGIIGGHLGRKRDGMPGTECIRRGLQRLDTAVDMYAIFQGLPLPQIRKSYPYAYFPLSRGP